MFSPALAHRQKKLARLSTKAHLAGMAARSGKAPPMVEEGPVATEYQSLLARLHDDQRRLHAIQSTDAKVALKRDLIGKYLPWVHAVLAAQTADAAPYGGSGKHADAAPPQDDIVVMAYIWAVDIRNWPLALQLAAYVIANGLTLPERFHRTAGGLLVSEMADAAINEPGSVPHDALIAATPGDGPAWDMKDETCARLYRAIGESWARQAETYDPAAESAAAGGKPMLIAAALDALGEATRLHPAVGVKKLVEQLQAQARKLAPPDQAEPAVPAVKAAPKPKAPPKPKPKPKPKKAAPAEGAKE